MTDNVDPTEPQLVTDKVPQGAPEGKLIRTASGKVYAFIGGRWYPCELQNGMWTAIFPPKPKPDLKSLPKRVKMRRV